jgi:hypothetical protein
VHVRKGIYGGAAIIRQGRAPPFVLCGGRRRWVFILFTIFFHLFIKIPLSDLWYIYKERLKYFLIVLVHSFGTVAVHMVGDGGTRGQQLELLLSLLLYLRKTTGTKALRLICMSATISNLDEIEQWLHAKKFYTK